jgi:hypothetical protein
MDSPWRTSGLLHLVVVAAVVGRGYFIASTILDSRFAVVLSPRTRFHD